ncbi:MAG: hypothetical protein HQL35_03515 [Alphaproteobacteria bacterium]|nr:hypothetical protein [Alphaproteobacteria bacterium]
MASFSYNYRAGTNERIVAGYLSKAAPDAVYAWLQDNKKVPDEGAYSGLWRYWRGGENRRLVEYLLWRRNDPVVDHGLARFGTDIKMIQRVYDRGDTSTRLAALTNPNAGIRIQQALDILKEGPFFTVETLLCNRYLPSEFLTNFFKRAGDFEGLDDDRFRLLIYALHNNERLKTPYESLYIDGFNEYTYNEPFYAAWELAKTVPATQEWAKAIWVLLLNCQQPYSYDNIDEVLERWQIDEQVEEPTQWHQRSFSFNVRVCIAGLIRDDELLRKSDDAALRMAFYQKFNPSAYKDWPSFLELDGEEFVDAALQNENLWHSMENRSALSRVCRDAPARSLFAADDIPNMYLAFEQRHREQHPQWFADEGQYFMNLNDPKDSIEYRLENIERALVEILERNDLTT